MITVGSVRRLAIAASVGTSLFGAPAGADQPRCVVVDVAGTTSWRVGQSLACNGAITLPPGARLKLVSSFNDIVLVKGPFSGTLDLRERETTRRQERGLFDLAQSLLSAVELIVPRSADAATLTDRGVFAIDISTNGDKCVDSDTGVQLARPSAERSETAVLTLQEEGAASATLHWRGAATLVAWPSDVPVVSGGSYVLDLTDRAEPRTFRIRVAPNKQMSRLEVAEWMADSGCTDQAIAVIAAAEPNHTVAAPEGER